MGDCVLEGVRLVSPGRSVRRGRGARAGLIVTGLLLTLLALLTGCGFAPTKAAPVPPKPDVSGVVGDRTVTQATRTGQRSALVHHPDNVEAGAPLVVVLHGEAGSAAQAKADYGWDALADREGFVVAYPDAVNHNWNAGPTCCYPNSEGVNDVGYLNELVSQLSKDDYVDRARVYAVGFSGGAAMVYSWECAQPQQLAGIGPVAGALQIGCPILPPISVAAIHGAADNVVPVGGGAGPRGPAAFGGLANPPLEQTLATFRGIDKCPDQPTATTGPPVVQRSWTCTAGRSVSVAIIDGAGHQWPGSSAAGAVGGAQTLGSGPDQPSQALNAADWIWQHLRTSRSR